MDQLTFRMAGTSDYPNLVQFWNEHAGWDTINRQIWQSRFIDTPLGPSEIALAFLREELIGQFIFVPFKMMAGEDIIKVYRAFAPVTSRHTRLDKLGVSAFEIILQMYSQSAHMLTTQGADLIYMVPDPRWSRLFKGKEDIFQLARFPLYSLPLTVAPADQATENCRVERINPDDERIQEAWNLMSGNYGNTLIRDNAYFRWKCAIMSYELYVVAKGPELVGLFALMNKGNDSVCMIGEVLSAGDEMNLKRLINGAIGEARRRKVQQQSIQKVAVLTTESMRPSLESLGFAKDDYTFTLVLHPLQETRRAQVLNIPEWYVGAGD